MKLLPRAIAPRVHAALADTPVVVINGPRQAGKTTLARSLPHPPNSEFVSLDEATNRDAAHSDPRAFVDRPLERLIIDEVQLVPELFRAIKAAVDRDRRPGRFLLTGSSRLIDAPDMADALVGRVEPLELWPFSEGELEGTSRNFVDGVFGDPRDLIRAIDLDRSELIDRILGGGFPEATQRTRTRRVSWFDSYVTTATRSVFESPTWRARTKLWLGL